MCEKYGLKLPVKLQTKQSSGYVHSEAINQVYRIN